MKKQLLKRQGKPEEVAKVEDSYTGKFLKPLLNTKFKKTA